MTRTLPASTLIPSILAGSSAHAGALPALIFLSS